jgi:hypothetical protein
MLDPGDAFRPYLSEPGEPHLLSAAGRLASRASRLERATVTDLALALRVTGLVRMAADGTGGVRSHRKRVLSSGVPEPEPRGTFRGAPGAVYAEGEKGGR